eukprot:7170031-Pyramimonas_sp.AAC.1
MALLEGEGRLFAVANAAVDRQAKAALSLHPAPDADFLSDVNLAATRAQIFMKLAAEVLPLFPNEVRWKRPVRIRSGRSKRT